jgi:tRNA(Ile)-lysidine synthase
MIHMLMRLPPQIWVACSGGVDSMAALDFLRRSHQVKVAFFDHHTPTSAQSAPFVAQWCDQHQLELRIGEISRPRIKGESKEEYWRNQRLAWLKSLPGMVVTAHHLDDCVETYIFNTLHGKPHTMTPTNGNLVKPFLITPKRELINWCKRKGVSWLEDESNQQCCHMRNHIRHQIVPSALVVNPGLHTVVKKLVLQGITPNQTGDQLGA